MADVWHLLITKGREIVGGAPVTQHEAALLLSLLTQGGADRYATIYNLECALTHLKRTGTYKPNLIIGVSLRTKSGVYVTPDTGLRVRVAQMLVTAYQLNNKPGLDTLVLDLRRIVSGTVAPGSTLLPFLSSEHILPKA